MEDFPNIEGEKHIDEHGSTLAPENPIFATSDLGFFLRFYLFLVSFPIVLAYFTCR